MSYLLDLVRTFDDAELQKFRMLDVIGKEELIRDAYAKHSKQNSFDESKLPAHYRLTTSHFDKINSLLLHKAIQSLYGNDYKLCLTSLVKRGLTALMLHELRMLERKIAKQKDGSDTLAFYEAAFEAQCSLFHPTYNAKSAQLYGQRYLHALGNKPKLADEVYVAMRIHQSTMVAQAMAGNEEKYRTTARKFIDRWKKELEHSNNKAALFHLYFTEAAFVKFYGSDVQPFLNALEYCSRLLYFLDGDMQREYAFRVYSELSFGYIESENFEAAEQYFDKAFTLPHINPARQSYQSGNYLNVCLINRHYAKAQRIFDHQLKWFIESNTNRSARFDVLLNAIVLHLHLKEFDTSFHYLQLMQTYKRNEITLMGQLWIRVCETLYFYCQGNYELAATLSKRNMRFVNRPENTNPQFEYHLQLFNCVHAISKQRQNGSTVSVEAKQLKQKLRGGMFNVFNRLL